MEVDAIVTIPHYQHIALIVQSDPDISVASVRRCVLEGIREQFINDRAPGNSLVNVQGDILGLDVHHDHFF